MCFNRYSARSSLVVMLLMILLVGGVSIAHALPRGVTEVTQVEGITEYRLKNGLTVLLFPDQSKETVTVNVTYKVGSMHENYGETGMAHLLEHLLFKGSKKHRDIPQELSEHGAKPNGTTSLDRTNYFETFTATEENIDWALSLESDRMVNSFIAKEDLDSEMTVVRNEFERSENSPFRVLMQRIFSVAYDWHNYGKPTIGSRSDIENVSIERLQRFYKLYYQPDNAVLTVAGKFDTDRLIKKINKNFGKIPKPKRALPELYTVEPAKDGERSVVVRRVGDLKIAAAAYHIPSGAHSDFAALQVLAQILGDTPRGRLHKGLVEKKLAVGAFAFNYDLQEPGMMFMAAQIEKDNDLQQAREALINIAEDSSTTPYSQEEVARAKTKLLKNIELALNSSESIAISLSEYIGMGDWRLLFLTRDRIESVTSEDVQRVAQTYLRRNNRTEGLFYPTAEPERVEIPKGDNLAMVLEGYTGREAIASGEAFDPSFANIASRSHVYTLDNGAKVALLPKKTRGESVKFMFSIQFGSEKSLHNKAILAETAGDMLMRGSQQYSREQISDIKDQLKTDLWINGYSYTLWGTAETTRENLSGVIHLAAELLQNPRFDKSEFDQLVSQQIASLEAYRQDPTSVVSRELQRILSPHKAGHPLYEHSIDERIQEFKALQHASLKAFHQEFLGAQNMQISVVGDFDEQEILNVLKSQFGSWKSREPYQRISNPYVAIEPVEVVVDTPDKENAAIVAALAIPVGKDHEDAPALDMGVYILGGGFLNSRLATRLRQQEGWSYSASAQLSLSNVEQRGSVSVFAIFAPHNRDVVKAGLVDELRRLVRDGITEEELNAAKSGMLQSRRLARTDNSTLASMWVSNLFAGRTMEWHKHWEDSINNLTVADVNKVLKKYINLEQLSFAVAADLSKSAVQKASQ